LDATFEAEYALHGPGKAVVATDANRIGVLEVGARQPSCPGNELQVLVSTFLPLKIAGLIATKFSRPAEDVLELLTTNSASTCLFQTSGLLVSMGSEIFLFRGELLCSGATPSLFKLHLGS